MNQKHPHKHAAFAEALMHILDSEKDENRQLDMLLAAVAAEPDLDDRFVEEIEHILGPQEDGTWNVSPFRWPGRIASALAWLAEQPDS